MRILYFLYTLLFYLAMPFVWLRLLWRARRNPDYAKRWRERLGHVPEALHVPAGGIWWHAVSVGEVLASVPLIKALQARYPQVPVIVTTMTPTGSAQVQNKLGDSVYHLYAPYDLPHVLQRFLHTIQPRLLVIMETELWPNMLAICAKHKIPVVLTNARLSAKSARGYGRFKTISDAMMKNMARIAVQSAADGERFVRLGLPRERLVVTGSIKFDIVLPQDIVQQAQSVRKQWGETRPVWIAASTHKGEEEIILKAMQKIAQHAPEALLILVPRHPDRIAEVMNLCHTAKLNFCRRHDNPCEKNLQKAQVFLIDTLGELLLFYATADVAFVGGSLINKGGHNMLEPAALGVPVVTGASLYNFAKIADLLHNAGALDKISTATELADKILYYFENKDAREKMGRRALEVVLQNRGALQKQLEVISSLISL